MSENNAKWLNIGIGAFIILAIVLLLVLILPFGNLVEQQDQIAVITINGVVTYDSSNSTKIFTSASQIENAINEANGDFSQISVAIGTAIGDVAAIITEQMPMFLELDLIS